MKLHNPTMANILNWGGSQVTIPARTEVVGGVTIHAGETVEVDEDSAAVMQRSYPWLVAAPEEKQIVETEGEPVKQEVAEVPTEEQPVEIVEEPKNA